MSATIKTTFVCGFFLLCLVSLGFSVTCAADAYYASCAHCKFGETSGQMEPSCYQQYQAQGTACTSAAYPIASGELPRAEALGFVGGLKERG